MSETWVCCLEVRLLRALRRSAMRLSFYSRRFLGLGLELGWVGRRQRSCFTVVSSAASSD
jgi:hypothetical protein